MATTDVAARWSANEDRVLRELYRRGAPIRTIAARVGRSEDAVSERRRSLGLGSRRRRRPPWTPAEDDLLRAGAAAGVPATVLADRLGRSAEDVRRRRRDLLGDRRPPRAYTAAEDEAIRTCWSGSRDVDRLARELGRAPGSVRLRARRLGLHNPPPRRRWLPAEDAALRDGYERGLTCAQIAVELGARSPAAVAARAAKLGLATYARAWTPADDLALRQMARDRIELERGARMLARTPEALRARARKLGLPPLRSRGSLRVGRRWTAEEDERLRMHAALNPATLAELVDRSPEAVTQRLRRLGLREARERSPHHPAPVRKGLTPGERATATRELRAGGARRQLAVAQRLGLAPGELRALAVVR